MKKRTLETKKLVLLGLFIALIIVFERVLSVETPFMRISLKFIPETMMGIVFGPFWSALGSTIADLTGFLLFQRGGFYFPGFTFNSFLTGLIYGWFYYKKTMTWNRAIVGTLFITVLINFILTPLWLSIMYQTEPIWWTIRGVKTLIMLPIQTIVTYYLGNKVPYQQFLK